MTTEDYGKSAYDIMIKHGQCQAAFRDEDDKVCLDGALLLKHGAQPTVIDSGWAHTKEVWEEDPDFVRYIDDVRRVERAIQELFPDCVTTIPNFVWHFNDHPGVSNEDILLVAKHAGV